MAKLIYKGKSLTGGGGSDLTYEVLATASATGKTFSAQILELKTAYNKLTEDEKRRSAIIRYYGASGQYNLYQYVASDVYSITVVQTTQFAAETIFVASGAIYAYGTTAGTITDLSARDAAGEMQLVLLDTEANGSSGGGTVKIDVDSELDTTSENPVQNKVIANALDGKQDSLTAGENITIDDDGTIHAVNVSGREVEMSYDADNDRLKFNTGEELSIKPNAGYRVVAESMGSTYEGRLGELKTAFDILSISEKLKTVILTGQGVYRCHDTNYGTFIYTGLPDNVTYVRLVFIRLDTKKIVRFTFSESGIEIADISKTTSDLPFQLAVLD